MNQHGVGFLVDAGVCIAASDRAGLERLLRYRARPPLLMARLHKQGADLVNDFPKPLSSGKRAELVLTPHGSSRKTPTLCACKTLTGALSVGDVDGPNL